MTRTSGLPVRSLRLTELLIQVAHHVLMKSSRTSESASEHWHVSELARVTVTVTRGRGFKFSELEALARAGQLPGLGAGESTKAGTNPRARPTWGPGAGQFARA
eukprot:1999258-Rhodomonas_salina.3